jgi:DNA mismatch repair protein MutS2
MTPLQQKSMQTLELPAILRLLAEKAVSLAAKERALDLVPSDNPDTVAQCLGETTAAHTLLATKSSPPFSGVTNVTAATKRAELGGVLSMKELLSVAQLLSAARQVKMYAAAQSVGCLNVYFSGIRGNKHLEESIKTSILSEDEMADAASPELASIRRHIRTASNKIRDVLHKIITSPAYGKVLQEPIITMRSDRYVVPVRSEYKNELSGLTHDVSSSGSTFFIEPAQVVNLNNEIRELAAKEKREIERILAEFSNEVASFAVAIEGDFHNLTALDLIFARAKLSYDMDAVPPVILPEGRIDLRKARHPLLPKDAVVPITVSLGEPYDTLVITGPNTGGKTVSLKTLGLLCLMARCGLHIPAQDGSGISLFSGIFADVGDEQSIEQSLSTFSSHMRNIVSILAEAAPGSLLLFDELGAGTDPVEGAALAVSILQFCRARQYRTAATTHYAELKLFATTTPGVENASCEFDVDTLRPTYRLLVGIPGKSNAFAIAQRLGLPESIINGAKGQIGQENERFEDILNQLEHQRRRLEDTQTHLESDRLKTTEDARRAAELRGNLEKERDKLLDRARSEARQIVENARQETDRVLRALDDERKKERRERSAVDWNALRSDLRRQLNQAGKQIGGGLSASIDELAAAGPTRPIVAGDTVLLRATGIKAHVTEISERDGTLTLQAGILRVSAKPEEVVLLDEPKPAASGGGTKTPPASLCVSTEIDLRGMTSEEALGVLDLFLDGAVVSKLETVRVIHGKGTGALRTAVQAHLRRHPQVKAHRLGRYGEGEDGICVVTMKG